MKEMKKEKNVLKKKTKGKVQKNIYRINNSSET